MCACVTVRCSAHSMFAVMMMIARACVRVFPTIRIKQVMVCVCVFERVQRNSSPICGWVRVSNQIVADYRCECASSHITRFNQTIPFARLSDDE